MTSVEILNDWKPRIWERESERRTGEMLPVQIVQTNGLDYAGPRYKVACRGRNLNKDQQWEWEPVPSSRGIPFLKRCRFIDFMDAVIAVQQSPPVGPCVISEPLRSMEEVIKINEAMTETMRLAARLLSEDGEPSIGSPELEALQELRKAIFYSP